MKTVIGIIGGIGSGKDTTAGYLSQKYDVPVFQISQPIKDIARERNIEPTRENLVQLGTELANEFGPDYFAKVILSQIESRGIITGMRQVAQIEYLKKHSNLKLISIEADSQIRFQRTQARGKLGEAKTFDEFYQNEIKENSAPRVQRLFDCMNNLHKTCRVILSAYKSGKLGQTVMPEDENPGFADTAAGAEMRLAYFTLPMALNYQRDSYKLWQAALKTYNDGDI